MATTDAVLEITRPPVATPGKTELGEVPKTNASAASNLASEDPKNLFQRKDPVQDLLDRLVRVNGSLAKVEPELARAVNVLLRDAQDPARNTQTDFRHQAGFVFQDLERSRIGRIELNTESRNELTRLATSAPGLVNERLQVLMLGTASITDHALVREVRSAAIATGALANQATPDIQSRIDTLENRLRLAERPTNPPRESVRNNDLGPLAPPGNGPALPPTSPPADRPNQPPNLQSVTGQGSAALPAAVVGQQHDTQRTTNPVLNNVLGALRGGSPAAGAPWDPAPTPISRRLAEFESKMREASDGRSVDQALKSGRVAVDAIQAFNTGEGAAVMTRIREAAQTTPGGIQTVLSEMREGGRFADLRKQFSSAVETDTAAAAAYEKAASALARYGHDRTGVQDIVARRPDGAATAARFEKLDAEVGAAASSTPGKAEGTSMIGDLATRAADLLHSAIEAVKSALTRSPTTEATARPGFSPAAG